MDLNPRYNTYVVDKERKNVKCCYDQVVLFKDSVGIKNNQDSRIKPMEHINVERQRKSKINSVKT